MRLFHRGATQEQRRERKMRKLMRQLHKQSRRLGKPGLSLHTQTWEDMTRSSAS